MATYPVITAGMNLTSALLASMLPLIADKTGDQSVTSSTTLQNDSALVVPVAASARYKFELILLYKGAASGTADIKVAFAAPSGASMAYSGRGVDTGLTARWWYLTGASQAAATNGTSNPLSAIFSGMLTTSLTAGNLQLQWAQNTSNATATTVMAGSSLTLWRRA